MATPWKSQKRAYEEALGYLKGRKEGSITSVKTGWPRVNNATTDGIEWHSMTVIGGRPATGKTAVKDQFLRDAFRLNTTSNMRALEFSLEMLAKSSAIRGFSSFVGRSYKYLCSADGKISDEDFEKCIHHAKEMIKYPIDVVEDETTVDKFIEIIEQYMDHHSVKEMVTNQSTGKQETITKYKNLIVTLDHSLLITTKKGQSKTDMLSDLGVAITKLKRRYPIIFIILSQLNRSIDQPERNEDGKYGNYVLDSDIFGSDALLQHADTVIGLNRPGLRKIRFYGPDRYIIQDDNVLIMHFLKCRNGVNGLTFFKACFDRMEIEEAPVPPEQQTRASTM